MKSSPQENEHPIETSCRDCLFSIYEDKTQTGCSQDRLKVLDHFEAYDEDDKEFFVIKGICNHFRLEGWNDGVVDIELLKKQVAYTFLAIIDVDKIKESNLENVKSYKKYYDNKVVIRLLSNPSNADRLQTLRTQHFDNCNGIATPYKGYVKDKIVSTERTTYTFNIQNSEQEYDLSYINNQLQDMNIKPICFTHKETLFISNLAYNMLRGDEVDYKNVEEKIFNYANEKNLYKEI